MHTSLMPSTRTRIAIGISIAVHVCGLALLAFLVGQPPFASPLVDEARFFPVTTTVRHSSTHTPTPTPMPMHPPRPRRSLAATATKPAPAPAPARPARIQAPAHFIRSTPRLEPRDPATDIGTRAIAAPAPRGTQRGRGLLAVTPAVTPTAVPTAAPTPATTATATATPAPAANTYGGLFSQNYPPALPAPEIAESLRARLGGHGRIRVDVDESGHATDVHFAGPIDDDIARDVRTLLLRLTYVPADCNGLHCDGTLEISY